MTCLAGKGLVELIHLDIVLAEARPGQGLGDGYRWGGAHHPRGDAHRRKGAQRGHDGQATERRLLAPHEHHRRRAVCVLRRWKVQAGSARSFRGPGTFDGMHWYLTSTDKGAWRCIRCLGPARAPMPH